VRYARLVVRNLLRNKRRTILTLASVAVSLFLMALLLTFLAALDRFTATDGSERKLITRNRVSLANVLPIAYGSKIARVPHVVTVSPLSWFGGEYVEPKNFFPQFAVDPQTYLEIAHAEAGFRVDPGQAREWVLDRRGVMVSQELADKYGWKLGTVFTIKGVIYPVNPELKVRAIFTGDDPAVYFHREYLEEALGRPGVAGTFYVLVDRPENLTRVSKAIDAVFANSDAETLTETEKAFQAGFVEMLGNVKGLVSLLSLVIGAVILLVTANTVSMSIRERATEVAVLKAIGFPRETILSLLVAEAVVLAVAGGVVGVGGFWGLTWLVFEAGGFRVPMFQLSLVPPVWLVAALGASTAGLGVSAAILPSWLVARRSILDGLRQV
jgi:putative ABC transport system permease protein